MNQPLPLTTIALAFAQSPVAFALLSGPSHVIQSWNARYEKLVGRTDLKDRPVYEAVPEIIEQGFVKILDRVFATGESYQGREVLANLQNPETGQLEPHFLDYTYEPFRDVDKRVIGIITTINDVTEQVNAREQARQSAEEFRVMAEATPQMMFTALPDGSIVYFNQQWTDFTGYTFEETKHWGWKPVMHPDDYDATVAQWTTSLQTGLPYEYEYRLKRKDGVYRWFLGRALPVRNLEGAITKWVGTNVDIHEQRVNVDRLTALTRDAEMERHKFETLFADASTSMALLRGPTHIFEHANPSYMQLFNNRPLVGKAVLEALPELVGQPFPELFEKVYKTGVAYVEREAKAYLMRTAEGPLEERYFDQTYTRVLDAEGNAYGVFIHAFEVTERVFSRRRILESESRLKLATETARLGTWSFDPVEKTYFWSERAAEIFGVPYTPHVSLETIQARYHPDDAAKMEKDRLDLLNDDDEAVVDREIRILRPDGSTRWLQTSSKLSRLLMADGSVKTSVVGTLLDFTDRVEARIELQRAKDAAENANAAKSAFLANMSHEIRTPLGAIMGFVGLMKDVNVTRRETEDYLSVIDRNSSQLLRIIDDILDLSKVEAGMMLIEHIDFSLVELLSDFSSLMGFRARDKGIIFDIKAMTELPSLVNSDPTRVRQILTNIVGNAIKFTDRGRVELQVSFANGVITFAVQDTGRGITKEQEAGLFQPFTQGDASITRKFGGTGLGLVLTRRLSEVLGGGFVLQSSELNKGSMFVSHIKVDVPANVPMVSALGYAPVVQGAKQVIGQLHGIKILLVEDSPDNQALISILLRRAGASIDIADNGLAGIESVMKHDYNVILMDVQMPVMDGITAVKNLRSRQYMKPIIALTAHAMKEERLRCLQAGFTDFLSKPIQREALIALILELAKNPPTQST